MTFHRSFFTNKQDGLVTRTQNERLGSMFNMKIAHPYERIFESVQGSSRIPSKLFQFISRLVGQTYQKNGGNNSKDK
jgi:hypothetical protein